METIATREAAKILNCHHKSVRGIVERSPISVQNGKEGQCCVWSKDGIERLAEHRRANPTKGWTHNTFTHAPTINRRVKKARLGRLMEEIEKRKDLDVLG